MEPLVKREINGLQAEWTSPGPDPRGVRLVQFNLTPDYAVSLISLSVNIADLLGYAHQMVPATEERWRGANKT